MTDRTVYFDCETGGVDPARHPLIQWAGVAVEGGKEVDSLDVRVRFDEAACDPQALAMNRYEPARWSDALVPAAAVRLISEFLRRHATVAMTSARTGRPYEVALLAGYNSAFDVSFTRALFGEAFLPGKLPALDVMQLALWTWRLGAISRQPRSFKLSDVAETLGVAGVAAHDALDDARTAWRVAEALRDRWPS